MDYPRVGDEWEHKELIIKKAKELLIEYENASCSDEQIDFTGNIKDFIELIGDNYTPMKVIEAAMDEGKVIIVESVGDLSIVKIGEESVIPVRQTIAIDIAGVPASKDQIEELMAKINADL